MQCRFDCTCLSSGEPTDRGHTATSPKALRVILEHATDGEERQRVALPRVLPLPGLGNAQMSL